MASKRIQGITIEIGGDTTKLQSALKGVDSQLKSTQNTLKDVDKLLKLNPGNVELLTQKQKNLRAAIDETKERLQTLKSVQTDALSPDEYDTIQREIIDTEQQLKSLEDQYRSFGSVASQQLQAVGKKVSETGKKISAVGTSMTKYVTAPILALGAGAYKAFTEVDEGLDTIIEGTGATGEALEEMRQIMEDIASDIPTDFRTAGEAVAAVNTRFGATGDLLRDLSTAYIKFAKINKTDVTGAVNSTQKALAAYGLAAGDAEAYLNRLTKVAQDTGISVDTLESGIIQNATAFQELGLSIDSATEFMGQLEKSGANSETVMQSLRKALKSATKDSRPLSAALMELQSSIENGTDSVDGLTAAYDLFGKSGDQIYGAVKNGTLDFTALASRLEGLGDVVGDTFEATLSPAEDFQLTMNNLKLTGADIVQSILPAVSNGLKSLTEGLKTARDWWNKLSEGTQNAIVKAIAIVAAIGPVVTIVGKLTSGVGSVIGIVGKLIPLISGGGGLIASIGSIASAAAPFLIGGAIIAGVIAATALIIKNWDKIKETGQAVGRAMSAAWKNMTVGLISAFDGAKAWIANGWNALRTSTINTVTTLKTGVIRLFDGIRSRVQTTMESIRSWIVTKFTAAKDGVVSVWNAITNALKKPVNGVIGLINGVVAGMEAAINWIVNGLNKIQVTIPNWVPGIGGRTFGVNLGNVRFGRINYLAKGGSIGEGQHAIVGENAPEYLRVVNGRAIVTPIDRARGDTTNNDITINIYAQPGQSAQAIAQEVKRIFVREQAGRMAAYA